MFSLALTPGWPPSELVLSLLLSAILTLGHSYRRALVKLSLLLFLRVSALDLLILTPTLTCLAMVDLKDPNTFRESSTFSPPSMFKLTVHPQTTCLLPASDKPNGACFSLILSVVSSPCSFMKMGLKAPKKEKPRNYKKTGEDQKKFSTWGIK